MTDDFLSQEELEELRKAHQKSNEISGRIGFETMRRYPWPNYWFTAAPTGSDISDLSELDLDEIIDELKGRNDES